MRTSNLFYYSIFLILVFISACHGQTTRHADADETQIAEYVVDIFEDSKDNLWFGTMAYGAARYNPNAKEGEDPLVYFTMKDGLPGMTISSFAEDQKGNIWIGGHNGVSYYDASDKDLNIIVTSNKGRHQYVDSLLPSNEPGLLPLEIPFEKADSESYAIHDGRTYLELEDSKGNLWYSVEGAGLYKVKGKSVSRFTKADGLNSNNINTVLEDKNGNIWVGCMQSFQPEQTYDGGVCKYNPSGEGKSFVQFPEIEGFHKNDNYMIYEDNSGLVWFGALGVGVYNFDGQKFSLIKESDRPDLIARFGLQGIVEDRKGELWMGFSGGLFRLIGDKLINVTQEDLRSK